MLSKVKRARAIALGAVLGSLVLANSAMAQTDPTFEIEYATGFSPGVVAGVIGAALAAALMVALGWRVGIATIFWVIGVLMGRR